MSEKKEASLFVKAAVRKYVNSKECNVAGDVIKGSTLNNMIKKLIDGAIINAKANKRKTIQAKDFKGLVPSA